MTTIVFTPDGAGHCLYTEAIDLSTLGTLSIKRATTIEFDNESQYWRVTDMTGLQLFNSPSRQECLEWERLHLDGRTADEATH